MTHNARLFPFLTVLALAAGCGSGKSSGPMDPPGAVVIALVGGSSIDFETGALNGIGSDLSVDMEGNFTATDRLSDRGPVAGLAAITELPTSWIVTAQGVSGHGYVVKSDESNAYAVFVSGGAADGGRTIHWILLPGVAVVRTNRSGGGVGSVTSDVGGIACVDGAPQWDCGEPFAVGTTVTLTALPLDAVTPGCANYKSVMTGWTGAPACTGIAPCAVTASADVSLVAEFKHSLSVLARGFGSTTDFTVTIDGATNPVCNGSGCTYEIVTATPITIRASSGTLTFSGWSMPNGPTPSCGPQPLCSINGKCGGQGNPCVINAGVHGLCQTIDQFETALFN